MGKANHDCFEVEAYMVLLLNSQPFESNPDPLASVLSQAAIHGAEVNSPKKVYLSVGDLNNRGT